MSDWQLSLTIFLLALIVVAVPEGDRFVVTFIHANLQMV